ncbi:MAG: hypothetical protein JF616_03020 [Fibrobacteres bacterium]|jgi:hypothetical protein|nr:hypothetical protein [Fibrobacterota bacterium]
MRGFLVLYFPGQPEPGGDSAGFSGRLGRWIASFPPGSLESHQRPGFACHLFSRSPVPPGLNQVTADSPAGFRLFVGPKAGLQAGSLPEIPDHGLDALAARRSLFGDGMETTVLLSLDARDGSLAVKTDLLNSTYVYHARIGGMLAFSNSSLLLARLTEAEPEPESLLDFLSTGSIYGNRSLFRGITTLRPSCFYKWEKGNGKAFAESRLEYWKMRDIAFASLSLREGSDRILAALDGEFAWLKRSGGKFVFDLTGGYDSRANVGIALRSGLPFRATVSGDDRHEDVVLARRISERYGIDLKVARPLDTTDGEELRAILEQAVACCDGEYDALEYANILHIHTRYFSEGEASVHGSTADVARNYFLLPGFYRPTPEGALDLDALIAKKFSPFLDPARVFKSDLGRGWAAHMRDQIAAYDAPGLPAYARLDLVYLRVRMQYWQGRIASSTNRVHSSFTPWTRIDVLEAILSTRWQEKSGGMLSRTLLQRMHPGLDGFPMTGGNFPGIGAAAALRSLPSLAGFFAGKVAKRVSRSVHPPRPAQPLASLQSDVNAGIGRIENLLHPDFIAALRRQGTDSPPALLVSRIWTVLKAYDWSRKI